MGFYRPIITKIKDSTRDVPVIVYPCMGIEAIFDRGKYNIIEEHISAVYETNKNRFKTLGQFHIDILWDDEQDIMTDIWIFDEIESWGSGALLKDVNVFRNLNIDNGSGLGAEYGLIVLGREAENRLANYPDSLDEFIDGDRPELPLGLTPAEDFYYIL